MKALNYFQITTFNGANPGQFYIQSAGKHAGKPLQMPSTECLTVQTDSPHAYEVAQCLFLSNAYAAAPTLRPEAAAAVLGQALTLDFCPNALGTLRVAIYESQHAREVAHEWLNYARSFALNLYQSAQATAAHA